MPEEQHLEDEQKPEEILQETIQRHELSEEILARKQLRARNAVGFMAGPAIFVSMASVFWLGFPSPMYDQRIMSRVAILMAGFALLSLAFTPLLNYLQYGKFFVRQRDLPTLFTRNPSPVYTYLSTREIPVADGSLNNTPEVSAASRPFDATQRRLRDEIEALARRGNLNLTIGVLTTIVGVMVLAYVVLSPAAVSTHADSASSLVFFTSLLSRISVAIFIEVFAFFFLRLYKSGLEDIRYYQNEITNIESKETALLAVTDNDTCELKKVVIEVLAKTERNGLLKKGETTVALERDRIERNELVELAKSIVTAYKK